MRFSTWRLPIEPQNPKNPRNGQPKKSKKIRKCRCLMVAPIHTGGCLCSETVPGGLLPRRPWRGSCGTLIGPPFSRRIRAPWGASPHGNPLYSAPLRMRGFSFRLAFPGSRGKFGARDLTPA